MSEAEVNVAEAAPKKRRAKQAGKELSKLHVVAQAGALLEKLPASERKSALGVLNKYFADDEASA